MAKGSTSRIPELVKKYETELLAAWMKEQSVSASSKADLIDEKEVRDQSRTFLALLREGLQNGSGDVISAPEWTAMRKMLASLSSAQAR